MDMLLFEFALLVIVGIVLVGRVSQIAGIEFTQAPHIQSTERIDVARHYHHFD
jgi:hypothetical protein